MGAVAKTDSPSGGATVFEISRYTRSLRGTDISRATKTDDVVFAVDFFISQGITTPHLVTSQIAQKFVDHLESGGYSVETVEQRCTSVSQYFTWLLRNVSVKKSSATPVNPMRGVRLAHSSSCAQCATTPPQGISLKGVCEIRDSRMAHWQVAVFEQ
jgi:site-specific recombinase XerC